jgi:hypothetical protein
MRKLLSRHHLLPLLLAVALLRIAPVAQAADPSTDAWYVMDREAYMNTGDERLVLTTYDLRNGPNLQAFPYEIGDWVGQDLPITNLETFPTLLAEQIVYRGYIRPSDNAMVILSLISGTNGQSFHHPIVCYGWASWETEDHDTVPLPLTGTSDVVLRYVVGIDPNGPRQNDLHFYLWPTAERGWAEGATQVRVTGIANESDELAVAAARDFSKLLFKEVRRPATPATTVPAETPPTTLIPDPAAPPAVAPEQTAPVAPAEPVPGEPPAEEPTSGADAAAPDAI